MAGFRRRETRPTRTLRSFVVRALLPRAAVFGIGAVMLLVGQAMAPDASAPTSSPAGEIVARTPSWTLADVSAFPGCVPSPAWPAGKPAGFVVVHGVRDDVHRKMSFGAAWRANHDHSRLDDVWVVGVCG